MMARSNRNQRIDNNQQQQQPNVKRQKLSSPSPAIAQQQEHNNSILQQEKEQQKYGTEDGLVNPPTEGPYYNNQEHCTQHQAVRLLSVRQAALTSFVNGGGGGRGGAANNNNNNNNCSPLHLYNSKGGGCIFPKHQQQQQQQEEEEEDKEREQQIRQVEQLLQQNSKQQQIVNQIRQTAMQQNNNPSSHNNANNLQQPPQSTTTRIIEQQQIIMNQIPPRQVEQRIKQLEREVHQRQQQMHNNRVIRDQFEHCKKQRINQIIREQKKQQQRPITSNAHQKQQQQRRVNHEEEEDDDDDDDDDEDDSYSTQVKNYALAIAAMDTSQIEAEKQKLHHHTTLRTSKIAATNPNYQKGGAELASSLSSKSFVAAPPTRPRATAIAANENNNMLLRRGEKEKGGSVDYDNDTATSSSSQKVGELNYNDNIMACWRSCSPPQSYYWKDYGRNNNDTATNTTSSSSLLDNTTTKKITKSNNEDQQKKMTTSSSTLSSSKNNNTACAAGDSSSSNNLVNGKVDGGGGGYHLDYRKAHQRLFHNNKKFTKSNNKNQQKTTTSTSSSLSLSNNNNDKACAVGDSSSSMNNNNDGGYHFNDYMNMMKTKTHPPPQHQSFNNAVFSNNNATTACGSAGMVNGSPLHYYNVGGYNASDLIKAQQQHHQFNNNTVFSNNNARSACAGMVNGNDGDGHHPLLDSIKAQQQHQYNNNNNAAFFSSSSNKKENKCKYKGCTNQVTNDPLRKICDVHLSSFTFVPTCKYKGCTNKVTNDPLNMICDVHLLPPSQDDDDDNDDSKNDKDCNGINNGSITTAVADHHRGASANGDKNGAASLATNDRKDDSSLVQQPANKEAVSLSSHPQQQYSYPPPPPTVVQLPNNAGVAIIRGPNQPPIFLHRGASANDDGDKNGAASLTTINEKDDSLVQPANKEAALQLLPPQDDNNNCSGTTVDVNQSAIAVVTTADHRKASANGDTNGDYSMSVLEEDSSSENYDDKKKGDSVNNVEDALSKKKKVAIYDVQDGNLVQIGTGSVVVESTSNDNTKDDNSLVQQPANKEASPLQLLPPQEDDNDDYGNTTVDIDQSDVAVDGHHHEASIDHFELVRSKVDGDVRPQRSLTSYNLFYRYKNFKIHEASEADGNFSVEKSKLIIAALPGLESFLGNMMPPDDVNSDHIRNVRRNEIRAALSNENLSPKKRKRFRGHGHRRGLLGQVRLGNSHELTRLISASWKELDNYSRSIFDELANESKQIHQNRLAKYGTSTATTAVPYTAAANDEAVAEGEAELDTLAKTAVNSINSTATAVGPTDRRDGNVEASTAATATTNKAGAEVETELAKLAANFEAAVNSINRKTTAVGPTDSGDRNSKASTTTTATTDKAMVKADAEMDHLAESVQGSPVPEFLCHLFSILREPEYSDLISWQVPSQNEPEHLGGGIRGIGKIVVHKPEYLQEHVLGRYYRHSKYASFQRQLNYFGFKKRLHNGKKGKLSPCSYIHKTLTADIGSLFTLKRRSVASKINGTTTGNAKASTAATAASNELPKVDVELDKLAEVAVYNIMSSTNAKAASPSSDAMSQPNLNDDTTSSPTNNNGKSSSIDSELLDAALGLTCLHRGSSSNSDMHPNNTTAIGASTQQQNIQKSHHASKDGLQIMQLKVMPKKARARGKARANGMSGKQSISGATDNKNKKKRGAASLSSSSSSKASSKRKNKKDDAHPRRPLSAYNLFFRYKRIKILKSYASGRDSNNDITNLITCIPGLEDYPSLASTPHSTHVKDICRKEIRSLLEHNLAPNEERNRLHRKSHGYMSFTEMSKTMCASWRGIDEYTKTIFEELAQEGRNVYLQKVSEYQKSSHLP